MFLFTKVENWRTVNFLPKCTRLHQIASQILKFSQGDTPNPYLWGGGHPSPELSSARRFPPLSSNYRSSPCQFFILHLKQSPVCKRPRLHRIRVGIAGGNWGVQPPVHSYLRTYLLAKLMHLMSNSKSMSMSRNPFHGLQKKFTNRAKCAVVSNPVRRNGSITCKRERTRSAGRIRD